MMQASYECDICTNEYLETEDIIPLILSECGHTVCKMCATRLKNCSSNKSVILCPYCSKKTIVKGDVMTLNKNFALMQIVNILKISKNSEDPLATSPETSTEGAAKCAEDWQHTATVYCSVCGKDFCEICWRRAHRLRVFSEHSKLPTTEKPPMCTNHENEVADLVCKSKKCKENSRSICKTCIITGRHSAHKFVSHSESLREYRTTIEKARLKTEANKISFSQNLTDIEQVMRTYQPDHVQYKNKEKLISDHFEKLRAELHQEFLKATEKLHEVAKTRLENLSALYNSQDEKMKKEELKSAEISHLESQDDCEFLLNGEWAESLANRVVDYKCPPLPDPMALLQLRLPSLNLAAIQVEPIFRLIGGTAGERTHLKESKLFSEFLSKNAVPASAQDGEQKNNRFLYKNTVIEMVSPDDECGEMLCEFTIADELEKGSTGSMIYAEVTVEAVKQLEILIAQQSAMFEKIVIGVTAFKGVVDEVKKLEGRFRTHSVQITIIWDKKKAIEQIIDVAIGL